jgi:hypothetical protein
MPADAKSTLTGDLESAMAALGADVGGENGCLTRETCD